MGLLLFITSLILGAILFSFSLLFTPIYYIVTFKWKTGGRKLNEYFYQAAIGVDQLGNRLCSEVLNLTLLKQRANGRVCWPGMEFGEIDDSISYVLGVNYYSTNLTRLGRFISKILNLIESYHIERALLLKHLSDLDAGLRLNASFFYKIEAMRAQGDDKLNKVIDELLGTNTPLEQNPLIKTQSTKRKPNNKPPVKRN